MDRGECVSLLPRVCEVLRDSGRSLPDDTSLEKLLDWFSGLTEAGGSLLEAHPCLLEFISTVVNKTSSDPDVISFALKLSGLIAATEDGFETLQERSVLDLTFNQRHWQEAGLWEDPCIRIGWIQGVRSMLQHSKALGFFVQADFIVPLLQLQTDSSLFVAAAANQTLAHVLLFFQPALSAGCNGTVKSQGSDTRTREHPGVTTAETDHDYSAVLVAISEYLKGSLVRGEENTRLHQSRQILKLLALLLARAAPPLRDKLLRTVADPLEELVTAGCSRLMPPLMDIVLAANSSSSVPDQRVTRLLSSMLNTNKPADRLRAAAAFLHSGHRDTVHTVRAVRILLLPLDIITGQTLLGADTSEEHRFSMVEQLKSKTTCVSMVCVCLTNTPQITLMPPDLLPCPLVVIVSAVLSLLRICCGDSSSGGCAEVFRNVIGSGKVQKCALEVLACLSSSPGVKDELTEVVTVLIQYLNDPDSDPTVIHKSYQALVKWMSVCEDLSSVTDLLRRDLSEVVRKRVCDMRWEVRDSTVEFLGKLAAVPKSAEETRDGTWPGSCSSAPLLREALQDPESYVRASAVAALAQTLARGWQQGAALTQEQTDIVSRLLEILSQDTEGFARRAVLQYFIAWFSSRASHTSPPSSSTTSSSSSSSLLVNSVSSILSLGSADLDWEVKVHTLELAELLLDEALSGHRGYRKGPETPPAPLHPYAVVPDRTSTLRMQGAESDSAGALSDLVERGVVSALLSGLVDCDRPVGLKACQLLITLRDTICPPPLETLDATPATATVARVSCELPACGWGREIRKILGANKCDKAKEADVAGETREEGKGEGNDGVSVCEMLRSLGLDARLDVLSQSSDHVHNSPLSLLQDILTASAAHTRQDMQPGQEVIVDCY
ncbi:putative BRCA1-associated ATM activator 1 [Scophthalmus maximus]|uniref:Putative BRCA1-associated ATM activator 1 n=1 Tax=Scophthalmus maximus TaxID=52904 RepID=A0A2U9BPJ5_SCOMX|nr:putative BRCA1-associated ATM activator 1 [Scophthalmus maximus]